MPSIRQTYYKFEELISKQQNANKALHAELRILSNDIAEKEASLVNDVKKIITNIDEALIATLDEAAETANADRSFSRIIAGLKQEDDRLSDEIAGIITKYGDDETRASNAKAYQTDIDQKNREKEPLQAEQDTLTEKNKQIAAHNEEYPDHEITPQTFNDLQSRAVLKWLSGGFRDARAAISAYEGDFIADRARSEELKEPLRKLKSEIRRLNNEKNEILRAGDKISERTAQIEGPAGLLSHVQTTFAELLKKNPDFAKALAGKINEETLKPALLSAEKLKQLEQVKDNLEAQKDNGENTLRQLENPMAKLRKGKRNRPSKSIRIDLDNIEKSVNSSVALSGYRVASAERTRQAINTYQHTDSGLFNMHNLMLIWMISEMSVDPAYAHETVGLDTNIAEEAGLDLDNLTPDVSGALEGLENVDSTLAESFNNMGDVDIGSLDIGTVDVSNIDVSVPTIDVPTIDVSSFDTGGMGGGMGCDF